MATNEIVYPGSKVLVKRGACIQCVVVVSNEADGGWIVKNPAKADARPFKVTNLVEVVAAAPAPESDAPKAEAPRKRKPREGTKMSLLNAAAEILREAPEPMRIADILKAAVDRGLWTPGAGKTPKQTLVSAIYREIKVRGEASRFRQTGRGLFTATAVG